MGGGGELSWDINYLVTKNKNLIFSALLIKKANLC